MKNYLPLKRNTWQGRIDDTNNEEAFRFHQVVQRINLNDQKIQINREKINFCFLGFCSDLGVKKNLGRDGAAKAPEFIRRELSNLPKTFSSNVQLYDAGNIIPENTNPKDLDETLSWSVQRILDLNLFPILLGGGHEIAYGHYMGILSYLNNSKKIGIINLDAHFDLRPYQKNEPNSGTMFLQIANENLSKRRDFNYFCIGIQEHANTISLFKKAKELQVEYILAKEVIKKQQSELKNRLEKFINRMDCIYLTLCSDVFSSAFAPGVSASQPFGLDPELVLDIIKYIASSNKLISFDIAEISPRFDTDNQTAKLGAVTIFALINTLIGKEKLHP